MNIDELISKYLDGELSEQEDALLRTEMSEDPLKKTDFDDAIFMHYALKEDAKALKVPEDLKRNTQDLVLMKIMNEQPTILKLQKRKRIVARLSYAVAAVLVFGFALISEFPTLKHYNQLYSYRAKESNLNSGADAKKNSNSAKMNDNSASESNNEIANSQNLTKAKRVSTPLINNAITNSAENMMVAKEAFKLLAPKSINEPDDATALASREIEPNVDVNNNTNSNVRKEFSTAQTEANIIASKLAESADVIKEIKSENKAIDNSANTSKINTVNSFSPADISGLKQNTLGYTGSENKFEQYADMQSKNPDIELSSCFGGNLMNNVFDDKISSFSVGFSQSLGYRVNKVHKFGFEFGFMNYTANELTNIKVPISVNSEPLTKTEVQQQYNGEPGPTVLVQVNSKNEGSKIWGTVFYEYRALDWDWFSLDTRIGIGGSKDGLLNLGRVTGSIQIFNGFVLNVGLDGRMFYTSLPKTYGGTSRLVGAMTFIYGFQINL